MSKQPNKRRRKGGLTEAERLEIKRLAEEYKQLLADGLPVEFTPPLPFILKTLDGVEVPPPKQVD